jgi:hypothetical protein
MWFVFKGSSREEVGLVKSVAVLKPEARGLGCSSFLRTQLFPGTQQRQQNGSKDQKSGLGFISRGTMERCDEWIEGFKSVRQSARHV